jgi:hypothetical protein
MNMVLISLTDVRAWTAHRSGIFATSLPILKVQNSWQCQARQIRHDALQSPTYPARMASRCLAGSEPRGQGLKPARQRIADAFAANIGGANPRRRRSQGGGCGVQKCEDKYAPHTARMAHDHALNAVIQALLKDVIQVYKAFIENESFKRFVGDMVNEFANRE